MRAMDRTRRWGRAAVAVGSLAAVVAAAGCGVTREATSAPAPAMTAAASQAGVPIVVSCEPTQRTIVRPTVVNGTPMSQVECVAGESQPVGTPALSTSRAMAAVPQVARAAAAQPIAGDLADTEVMPVAGRSSSAAPIRARQVVYDERRAPRRSVKKSAVIIGSSAGVGAGVGAVLGGKKGALLGAVVGGGGATLWDQITRHKN